VFMSLLSVGLWVLRIGYSRVLTRGLKGDEYRA
jgi:hypothetical protein